MSLRHRLTTFSKTLSISGFDLIGLAIFIIGGFLYLHNCVYWGDAWIGDTQYGDAEFWWNGAIHVAHGIFKDNPGQGYRPGYFVLTGLAMPILGMRFQQYFPYFLLAFLTTASLFYYALRQILGRWIAGCVVGMLIFNPYTAEWLSTSTTDATGLLLNIAALSCLLLGIYQGLKRNWLIAFGVLFSLATLTRPLVTPYIGVVLVALLIFPKESFKKKIKTSICIIIAFCIPTLLWMSIQKLTIDQWSLSSNDASAFYAASDPKIQVWNNEMYGPIKLLASKKYHEPLEKVTDAQLNNVFWEEAVKNYFRYPQYHLTRLAPHIFQIARFTPNMASNGHGTEFWRTLFSELISAGLFLWLIFQKRFLKALFFVFLGITIYLSPHNLITLLTLAGALSALFMKRSYWENKLGIFLLSTYWLIGVIALYLVGGTWGTPSFTSPFFVINALGYRLGSQIFFIGDLLAAYFLLWIANFKPNLAISTSPSNNNLYQKTTTYFCQPATFAENLVLGFFSVFLFLIFVVYLIGAIIVTHRTYSLTHSPVQSYPSLAPIVKLYQSHNHRSVFQDIGENGGLKNNVFSKTLVKKGYADVIFTGTISSFIWNMLGQERSQIMAHTQKQTYPYTLGPGFAILDVPQHLNYSDWNGQQGAFIIQQLPDNHNISNQAYYLTTPIVRAFVPLSRDKKSFELEKTVWFPLVKNATQLETDGELRCLNAKITWSQNSGQAPFQRRFFLTPSSNKALLELNVGAAHGSAILSFAYSMGDIPGQTRKISQGNYEIKIFSLDKATGVRHEVLSNSESIPPIGAEAPLKKVEFHLSNNTQTVEILFDNLAPETGIWIYEFNLKRK